jgi:hypothetical protein
VSGQHHVPAALYPQGKNDRYPLYRRLGGSEAALDEEVRGKNPLPVEYYCTCCYCMLKTGKILTGMQ